MRKVSQLAIAVIIFASMSAAQTGGGFDLSHSVVASGGGSNSSGRAFILDGTIGQPIAGTLSGSGTYRLRGGFWAHSQLIPTAAVVSISGRVADLSGLGLSNIALTLLAPDGSTRSVRSSTFGYFRFDSVAAGQVYILSVRGGNRYVFPQPDIVITVNEDITGIEFIAAAN